MLLKWERNCHTCWWNCQGSCKLLLELRELQKDYKRTDTVCWAWRPINKEEKLLYLEKYGREIERLGIFPTIE